MSFTWHGEAYVNAITEEIKDGLLECGEDLRGKSMQEAPVDTGDLRGAAVVDVAGLNEGNISVGYSSGVDAYSMVQHERLDFNHPRGGKAKYLEDPFNANKDRYIKHLGEAVRRGTQG